MIIPNIWKRKNVPNHQSEQLNANWVVYFCMTRSLWLPVQLKLAHTVHPHLGGMALAMRAADPAKIAAGLTATCTDPVIVFTCRYLHDTLPILDTLQTIKFLLVSRYSHYYQKTKGLKYPCKIDPVILFQGWWESAAFCVFLYLFVAYIFLERPVNLHEDAISLKAQKHLNNGQHLVPNKFRAYPEKNKHRHMYIYHHIPTGKLDMGGNNQNKLKGRRKQLGI